jgi:formate dehydrogenase subunit beta
MKAIIPVENGETLGAIQGFLKELLTQGVVEALLTPMRTPHGAVTPALVSRPDLLDAADPLAPVMPGNAATLAGKLSIREPRVKVGAVLRACEARALVELVKLQQASLDDLTVIAVDCAGTFEVAGGEWREADAWRALYNAASTNPQLRLACRMCEQPVYDNADITIELLGSDWDQELYLSLPDGLAEKLSSSSSFVVRPSSSGPGGRAAAVDKLVTARTAVRDADYAAIRARLEGDEGIIGVFDTCIRCHNCMTVCPICYCKVCVFKSQVFDHEPMQYVGWANQKGAMRLPADTSLFHLTRLNHMGLSCVGCGMCTQACPAELPVGSVFRAIGQRLGETFDYMPGRSVDESLPLITFKENEWLQVGEE